MEERSGSAADSLPALSRRLIGTAIWRGGSAIRKRCNVSRHLPKNSTSASALWQSPPKIKSELAHGKSGKKMGARFEGRKSSGSRRNGSFGKLRNWQKK